MPDVAYIEFPAQDKVLARATAKWRSYVQSVDSEIDIAGARRANGQFASALGYHAKLELIAKVARLAAGEGGDPRSVGRVRFEQTRRDCWPQLPCADSLRRQFEMSLTEIIAIALNPNAATAAGLARDPARAISRGTSNDAVLDRLRVAQAEFDTPLTPDAFDRWGLGREVDARRRGWSVAPEPNSATVIARFASWATAMKCAGLTPPARVIRGARPIEELLDEFIDQLGFLPTKSYFVAWCERMDISIGRDAKPWGAAVARVRAYRAARDKETPAHLLPRRQSPELPEPRQRKMRDRPTGWWTRERCIAALKVWAEQDLGGRRPSTRTYKGWATGNRDAPPLSSLQRHGTFAALCREAGI